MKSFIQIVSFVFLFAFLNSCTNTDDGDNDTLYKGFVSPPSEARPFVRWWWNGDHLNETEISREINVLKAAGFGGVEINPIAMPEEAKNIGTKAVKWLSDDWIKFLTDAAMDAKKQGMIADLIVGSGWPFGGEFLKNDETIQRIISQTIQCSGNDRFDEDFESLYQKALGKRGNRAEPEKIKDDELFFIQLVPASANKTSEIIDLTKQFRKDKRLKLTVPKGNYELVFGILQHQFREVMHGAEGAAGSVMDHYKKEVTRAYLNRLKKISEVSGIPLNKLIRALFCDSIELSGANWTDGFDELFFQTYQYRLEPYYPFVFYDSFMEGYSNNLPPALADQIKRVRYDYNRLLVNNFLDNFTREFQDFCTENGVLCRYQAYGTPFLMGIMDGNLITDIPESNNWIYSADMNSDEWKWNQEHGYMIWNLYASSGGHLIGKKIVSCESMTNTRGVFKTSLEEIKQNDDMNFITGINHSVLHGFNYSPPEAGFPGWVRYGTYFSEQNTWWPYIKKWTDYNARLSYVFQQSQPVKSIAIMAPEGDIWSNNGLVRLPFHMEPWYCHRLWEPISQAGSSFEYINETIINKADKANGELVYGPMAYKMLILCGVQSVSPETAFSISNFVKKGGKLVLIDKIPERSLSMKDAEGNDKIVKTQFESIISKYPERVFKVESPSTEEQLLPWTQSLLEKSKTEKDVKINNPDKNVFQIHEKYGNKDIYFFTNSNRVKTISFDAKFATGEKVPYEWNPETGARQTYPYNASSGELTISLTPLQSLLLVFEPSSGNTSEKPVKQTGDTQSMDVTWDAKFIHIDGQSFERKFKQLSEFGTSEDPQLNTFAGTVIYSTDFNSNGQGDWIELGNTNKGISEVILNGKNIGTNWYGKPLFSVSGLLKQGKNHLEIKYTTVLSNYVMSMKDDPTATRWTRKYEKIPVGLDGNISVIINQ